MLQNKKPQTFQGYWHQAREREAQLIRLKNQVLRVILWIVLSVIFAGVMIPW